MVSSREKVVFIAFSDTHGNRRNLSQLYTLIKDTVEKEKAAGNKPVLLIPGDVFSVNAACSVVSNGEFDIDVVTAIANLFDEDARFFTPGNHDYFYEESQLVKLAEKAKLKVVITNTQFTEQSKLKFEKAGFVLTDTDLISIAGLMTPETLSTPGARKVIKDQNSVSKEPAELKEANCKGMVDEKEVNCFPPIIMSHLGSKNDLALPYSNTTIVGGHSHDKQVKRLADKTVVNTGAGECIVVMHHGKEPVIKEIKDSKPSEVVEAIVKRYMEEHKLNLTEKIFTIDPNSTKPSGLELSEEEAKTAPGHIRTTDAMVTRLTADSIAAELRKNGNKVDFVLYPAAAIRSNFEAGQVVTEEELLETYYYSNKLAEVTLTGAQLVELLAHGIMSGYKCYINRGQLLVPSAGLSYEYDIDQKNPGDTIRSVKVNGKYINLQEKFTIVTTDWVAGDIKTRFKDAPQKSYPDDLKIYKLVKNQLKNTKQKENFGERVISTQPFKKQLEMTTEVGNRRADKPAFDRMDTKAVPINLSHHQAKYFQENKARLSDSVATAFAGKLEAPPTTGTKLTPITEHQSSL